MSLTLPSSWAAATDCALSGEPVHWIADYCMSELSTDDEIAAGPCIARELRVAHHSICAARGYYKRAMCRLAMERGRPGTLAQCLADPAFVGSTVVNKGVGR